MAQSMATTMARRRADASAPMATTTTTTTRTRARRVRCRPPAASLDQHWALAPFDARERLLVDRLLSSSSLEDLMAEARAVRDTQWPGDFAVAASSSLPPLLPRPITFSPKVFIPLTRACRDSCAYCTFAQPPTSGKRVYMTLDEVAVVAKQGAKQGCTEALLTLGDRPEARWPEECGNELQQLGGYKSTLEYLEAACAHVLAVSGLIPHVNAGIVDEEWARRLKRVSASQGLMLEGVDPLLNDRGQAHDASACPDKLPAVRLAAIESAGRAAVPFTTGVLVGIGESREERLRALVAISRLHARFQHVQEVIVQNFVPKPGTAAEHWPAPSLDELLWSVACARLILPPDVSVQAPPNLTPPAAAAVVAVAGGDEQQQQQASSSPEEASWRALLSAGINDWGGLSPLTRDWVNPERAWPHVAALARATEEATGGRPLLPRLPIYPRYALLGGLAAAPTTRSEAAHERQKEEEGWLSEAGGVFSVAAAVRRHSDGTGLSRGLAGWFAGVPDAEDQAEAAAAAGGNEDDDGAEEAEQEEKGAAESDADKSSKSSAKLRPASGAVLARPSRPRTANGGRDKGDDGGWAVSLDAYGGTLSMLPPPSQVSPPLRALLTRLLDPERDGREASAGSIAAQLGGGGGNSLGPSSREIEALLSARGADAAAVRIAADALRKRMCGDDVTYVVNRNLNYTNVCSYGCTFCGFSKARPGEEDGEAAAAGGGGDGGGGSATARAPSAHAPAVSAHQAPHKAGRDPPYVVSSEEVSRRAAEAWERGATEICMQGGIHPQSTGETYLRLLRAAKQGAPQIHAHAFSPLEVTHGAATLGMSVEAFLRELRKAGLGSLPGTAAEILDDDVRALICPDKLSTSEWCDVMEAAASVARDEETKEEEGEDDGRRGNNKKRTPPPLRATSTLMFGHVENPAHIARHLLVLRGLQARTRGLFTEFVPLPFVAENAPAFSRLGQARRGPTLREAVLAHSAARLVLHPHITNIQASWVKMGPKRASGVLLQSGCNDMGGTLMQESITRASGAAHGQELGPREMERLIAAVPRRTARQRTTTYLEPDEGQVVRSLSEAGRAPLRPGVKLPAFAAEGRLLAEEKGLLARR